MCDHRAKGGFGRAWSLLVTSWLVSFFAVEIYGLITVGSDATLSTFLRRRAGLLEPCRHSLTGRTVIVAVGLWLIAHLGWGRWGFDLTALPSQALTSTPDHRRRVQGQSTEVPSCPSS